MNERSLGERIVAILGVLVGTIAWVVRLLLSLVRGLFPGGSEPTEGAAGSTQPGAAGTAKTYATDLREKGESLLGEVKEKGGALIGDAKEKGHVLVEEAREKVDDVIHRGEEGGEGDAGSHFTAEGSTADDRSDVSSAQHEGLGGVPERLETSAAASGDDGPAGRLFDEPSTSAADEDGPTSVGTHVTEGIPNLAEPGEEDEAAMYGGEPGSLMGRDQESGYAGQAMSESDIGIGREDSISGFADSGDRSGGEFRGWISDEVNLDRQEATGDEDDIDWVGDQVDMTETGKQPDYDTAWVTDQINADDEVRDEEDDDVPAASRGWQAPADDVLKDDPLYGDFESSGTGAEADLRNDEAGDADAAGMHIIDSPDEPFVEDEDASQSLGFTDVGTEPPFDTTTEEIDVDEIGSEQVAISEDSLVADALGHPAGGDAASGDLGPSQSPDDATWEPGASRPDYDVLGAYDGSGVDEFADDSVAERMLEDIGPEADAGEGDAGTSSETGSVAWATSSGVIDPDLAKPLSADELQAASDASAEGGESGEPGVTEADADLKDVAAGVAQDMSAEMGDGGTATGTTMSGAGQSAGAMTSDDAATGESTSGEMTTDSGSVETGGLPATDEEAGEGGVPTGSTGGTFADVLPESEYASSVGYETLTVDDGPRTGRDDFAGSSFLTETSTSGVTPATSEDTSTRGSGRNKGPAPEGAVRGDGSGTCPEGYPIKGNASSHIYHRPTDSSYQSTIPEFCFATEEDAKAAGFRPRKG